MTYEELENQIRKLILEKIEYEQLSFVDGAAIAYILSQAEDEKTLEEYLHKLTTEFSFIQEIFENEKSQIKENIEKIVENFIKQIISDDPILASQIASEAMNPNASMEDLKSKYPKFAEYISTQLAK